MQRCSRYRAPMINEGGAIHTDGEGTLLVTEQCLLNPNRNPRLSLFRIEQLLRAYLGAERIVWLGAGVVNDETGGANDNPACLWRAGQVGPAPVHQPRDEQEPGLRDGPERAPPPRAC